MPEKKNNNMTRKQAAPSGRRITFIKQKTQKGFVMLIKILLRCLVRKWKYGDREKFVFDIRGDSDCTTYPQ